MEGIIGDLSLRAGPGATRRQFRQYLWKSICWQANRGDRACWLGADASASEAQDMDAFDHDSRLAQRHETEKQIIQCALLTGIKITQDTL
ncbi:MAG: hypothetical protein ABJV68_08770 [Paracoccaceae bacterium]